MSGPGGEPWHVERRFLEPGQALSAAEQARRLQERAPDYVEDFQPATQGPDSDITVLKVILEGMPAEDRQKFADLFAVAATVNAEAARLAGTAETLTGEEPVFLNFYKRGAATGAHRDEYTPTTVAVGLSGMASAYIWDSARGAWRWPTVLAPTDALCLDNRGQESERPLHIVKGFQGASRISIVNAAGIAAVDASR